MTSRSRLRVLKAFGNRCAWCQDTTGPFEFDHIIGGGNLHRQAIQMPLADWLVKEHRRTGRWSSDIQLLCKTCHDRKSGRQRRRMPIKKGTTAVTVGLADDLAQQLTHLAADPTYGSKANVIDTALRHLLAGSPEQSLLDGLHQQLATVGLEVRKGLHTLEAALATLTAQVGDLATRVADLEDQQTTALAQLKDDMQGFQAGLNRAYDHLKERVDRPRKWFG